MLCTMVWTITLLQRVRHNIELLKWIYGNDHGDLKIGFASNAHAAHRHQNNTPSTTLTIFYNLLCSPQCGNTPSKKRESVLTSFWRACKPTEGRKGTQHISDKSPTLRWSCPIASRQQISHSLHSTIIIDYALGSLNCCKYTIQA